MRTLRFAGYLLMLLFLGAVTRDVRAQGKFGVGLIFGEPTGVAWKYRISEANAVDGAIGLSPSDRLRFHVDYLWEKRSFQEEHLRLHYGAGAAFGVGEPHYLAVENGDTFVLGRRNLGFALRGVVGLTYDIPRSPLDVFLEIAPLLIFTPDSGMGIDAAIGIRIYP